MIDNAINDPELVARVREDIRCHRENGVDLNPYSTPGRRESWQRGFAGQPELLLDWTDSYNRGRIAARLIATDARS
ncbi:MAG: hypothetical protein ACK5XA_08430 [Tagaea sp.]